MVLVEHRGLHGEPMRNLHRKCLSELDRLMPRNRFPGLARQVAEAPTERDPVAPTQTRSCVCCLDSPEFCHDVGVTQRSTTSFPHKLNTPRAAAIAGVLFAVLFGAALILIRTALPEGAAPGSQWLSNSGGRIRVASILMPFAGICFLWFIGVIRDGFGGLEDRFFSSVFFGSGLLFLAMIFASSAVGEALAVTSSVMAANPDVASFGQMVLLALSKTYALRMAAVFMISLATIWRGPP